MPTMKEINSVDQSTPIDIERSIAKMKEAKDKYAMRKQECQAEFSVLKNKVRSRQFYLPAHEYKTICDKQDQLRLEILDIEKNMFAIKNQIAQRERLKKEMKYER